jgi:hypothetical protein
MAAASKTTRIVARVSRCSRGTVNVEDRAAATATSRVPPKTSASRFMLLPMGDGTSQTTTTPTA